MIELRACETDADYEAWLGVRRAVVPHERAPSLDELKQGMKPNELWLLAELDGELAGSGLSNARTSAVRFSCRACCGTGAATRSARRS